MFLISFRNFLCPQQMFPSLRSTETIMSNNASATMCPRLPPPLGEGLGGIWQRNFQDFTLGRNQEVECRVRGNESVP